MLNPMMRTLIFILSFLSCIPLPAFSQNVRRLNIVQANRLEGSEKGGMKLKKLIGDVILEHDGTYMYCDSAYHYESDDYFIAYGNVRIRQGSKFELRGNYLNYNLKSKMAVVDQNVRLTDNEMTLTTKKMYYDMNSKIAYYTQGGQIMDAENTLTSEKGYYYVSSKDAYFKKNVKLTNPDFVLTTDSLKYNLNSRRTTFLAPTTMWGEDLKIYCEEGWYNSITKETEFRKNAYIFNKEQHIYGDILFYNTNTKDAWAKGRIVVYDTIENTKVSGNYSEKIEALNVTYVTDSALFVKYMNNDTLYLHADTLKLIKDSTTDKDLVSAYPDVRAFSSGFSVRCDSMIYNTKDSMIWFYHDPVLWHEKSQITADLIILYTKNDEMDKMELQGNGFLAEQVDSMRFNQVKGRSMMGYFKNNKLDYLDAEGNAESIYFLTDDENKFVGRNNITSSTIRILMGEDKIQEIRFMKSPSGKVTPPESMDDKDAFLEGFHWQGDKRPLTLMDLFFMK